MLQETRDMLNKLKEEEVTVLHKDNIKSISVKKAEVGLEKEQRKESVCGAFAGKRRRNIAN